MNNFKTWLLVLMSIMLISLLIPHHKSCSQCSNVYQIDEPFDKVRKVMMRKDSLRKMVEYSHGELISENWQSLTINPEKILRDWNVDGVAYFTIRMENKDTGSMILNFRLDVHIDQDWMESKVTLLESAGCLKEYTMYTHMLGNGDVTKVTNEVSIVYERFLPISHVQYVDKRVDGAACNSLFTSQEATIEIVKKHNRRRFLFHQTTLRSETMASTIGFVSESIESITKENSLPRTMK